MSNDLRWRERTLAIRDVGAVALALSFAVIAGVDSAYGQQIPDIVSAGLGASIGYFLGSTTSRSQTNGHKFGP